MKILELNNIFLTRSGIGLKRLKLVDETIHQYKGKRTHFWLYALYQFFFKKKIHLTGNYFIIHNHWCPGYYHWITEALPRLFIVKEYLKDHILVLPDNFRQHVFDATKPLYNGEVFWIPQGKNLKVENLLIPENPPFSGIYDKELFGTLRKIYIDSLAGRNIARRESKKIYISRSKAARRKVINEAEVINALLKKGFEILNFEDFTFWNQVAIVNNADVLVSIHGAGLSNVLFMNRGSKVVELQKSTEDKIEPDVLYRDFCLALDLDYSVLYCNPETEGKSIYEADIIVDVELLCDLLPDD